MCDLMCFYLSDEGALGAKCTIASTPLPHLSKGDYEAKNGVINAADDSSVGISVSFITSPPNPFLWHIMF